jgi:hypothetical protein
MGPLPVFAVVALGLTFLAFDMMATAAHRQTLITTREACFMPGALCDLTPAKHMRVK